MILSFRLPRVQLLQEYSNFPGSLSWCNRGLDYADIHWELATPTEVNGQEKLTKHSSFKYLPVAAGISITQQTQ